MSDPDLIPDLKILDFVSENFPIQSVKTLYGNINFVMLGETAEFRLFLREP